MKKYFSFLISHFSCSLGFTYLELILYIGIITIILTSLIPFAWNVIEGGAKTATQREIFSQGRYVSERIKFEIRNANGINSVSPTQLSLSETNSATNPTIIALNSGNITIRQGISAQVTINSKNTVVSGLTFTNNTSADNRTKNIQFVFTIAANYPGAGARQEYNGSTTIESTAEILANASYPTPLPTNTPTPTPAPTPTPTPLPSRGGMLVYGDGGTTSNVLAYKPFNGSTGTWGSATNFPSNPGSSNWYVRSVRVYASKTRNEKVVIVSLNNGSNLAIYANVWNGSAWGSWTTLAGSYSPGGTYYGQPFDGTYLNNGDFMAIYADGTGTPKAQIWNGTSWGSLMSLISTSCVGTYYTASARPGTNEVMATVYNTCTNIYTYYYNGNGYINSNWVTAGHGNSSHTSDEHQLVTFAWSPYNPLKGGLNYAVGDTVDNTWDTEIFTANGSGGGTWASAIDLSSQSGAVGAGSTIGSPNSGLFTACDVDQSANNNIYCYDYNFTPAQQTVNNGFPLSNISASGVQRSFDIGFDTVSGNYGLIVYSDNTSTPKYKKYTPGSTGTWDPTAGTINSLSGKLESVKLRPVNNTDDIIALMADANNHLYSIVWNGSGFYTSPSGKAFSTHGTNGSATTDFWYDFAWDGF